MRGIEEQVHCLDIGTLMTFVCRLWFVRMVLGWFELDEAVFGLHPCGCSEFSGSCWSAV